MLSILFGKKKPIETCGDIVAKNDWAEKELEEAEKSLSQLLEKLQESEEKMNNAAIEAEEIINRHREILITAKQKRSELTGKKQRVQDLLNTIKKLKGEENKATSS